MLKNIMFVFMFILVLSLTGYVVWTYSFHYVYIILITIVFVLLIYIWLYKNSKFIRTSSIRYSEYIREKYYSVVKLPLDVYMQRRKYNKFISKIDSSLTRMSSSLNCRDIFLIFCDKSMEESTLLLSSGGSRVKVDTSDDDFRCWDVNGNIYFEMISDNTEHAKGINPSKNTIFSQCVEKYILGYQIKSIVVCEKYNTIRNIRLEKKLSATTNVRDSIISIHAELNNIIPVQLVVTECHYISGMSQFYQYSNMINEKNVIRYVSDDTRKFRLNAEFLDEAFKYIYLQMGNDRLSLPIYDKNSSNWPEMYSTPENIQLCKNDIGRYLNLIISDSRTSQCSPFVGIYFSLGDGEIEKIWSENSISNSEFNCNQIMLIDRYSDGKILSSYISEIRHFDRVYVTKKPIFTNAKMLSTYILTAAYVSVCLLTSLIFIKSYQRMNYLSNIDKEYYGAQIHTPTYDKVISKFGDKISHFDYKDKNSRLPNFGFNQPEKYLKHVKNHYVKMFQHTVLEKKNQYLDRSLDLIRDVPDSRLMSYHIKYLRDRIENIRNMLAKIENRTSRVMNGNDNLYPALEQKFNSTDSTENLNFSRFMRWQNNEKLLNGMIAEDRKRLYRLVFLNNKDDAWIYSAISDDKYLSPIELPQLYFSQLPSDLNNEMRVDRAYSTIGRDNILKFLNEVGEIYSNESIYIKGYSPVYDQRKNTTMQDFDIQYSNYLIKYNRNYLLAWKNYLTYFSKGFRKLFPGDYPKYVASIKADKSVYEKILLQAFRNLLPIRDSLVLNEEPLPEWLVDIMRLGQVVDSLKTQLTLSDASGLVDNSGAHQRTPTFMSMNKYYLQAKNTISNFGETTIAANSRSSIDETETLYKDFMRGLSDLFQTSSKADKAFVLLSEYIETNTSRNEGLIQSVIASYKGIEEVLFQSRQNLAKDLVHAQLLDTMVFVIDQSKIHMQNHWNVLYELEFDSKLGPQEKLKKLQADSKFWKFYRDYTSKLIIKNADYGYRNYIVRGQSIELSSDYLYILSLAEKLKNIKNDNYNIKVKTVPAEIKTSNGVVPAESKLTLICNQTIYEIENKNYQFKKSLSFDPLTCTEITIDVISGSTVLRKKYVGDWCYFDFRKQYLDNSMTLRFTDMELVSKLPPNYKFMKIKPGFSLQDSKQIILLSALREITLPKSILSTNSI